MKYFALMLVAYAEICHPLENLWTCEMTKPVKAPRESGLVLSYRKKTCQQLVKAEMNETTREAALNKMKCNQIDFEAFDASNDEYLNKDISEGMKLLMNQ